MSLFSGIGDGARFVDRGDVAAYDWGVGDFTTDGNWHDLDLSGIVPAEGAGHLVLLRVALEDNAPNSFFQLKKGGAGASVNSTTTRTQVNGVVHEMDLIVACDSSRVVQYAGSNTAFTKINLVVRGWWKDG